MAKKETEMEISRLGVDIDVMNGKGMHLENSVTFAISKNETMSVDINAATFIAKEIDQIIPYHVTVKSVQNDSKELPEKYCAVGHKYLDGEAIITIFNMGSSEKTGTAYIMHEMVSKKIPSKLLWLGVIITSSPKSDRATVTLNVYSDTSVLSK